MISMRRAQEYAGGFAMGARCRVVFLVVAIAGLCSCGAVPATKYYQLKAPAEVTPHATAVTEVAAKTRLAARRAGRGIRIGPGYPVTLGRAGSAPGLPSPP